MVPDFAFTGLNGSVILSSPSLSLPVPRNPPLPVLGNGVEEAKEFENAAAAAAFAAAT